MQILINTIKYFFSKAENVQPMVWIRKRIIEIVDKRKASNVYNFSFFSLFDTVV